jgi:hypothetical protein
VVILDHHKTAAEHLSDPTTLPTNLHVTLDMGRSGAVIARDFFAPEVCGLALHGVLAVSLNFVIHPEHSNTVRL